MQQMQFLSQANPNLQVLIVISDPVQRRSSGRYRLFLVPRVASRADEEGCCVLVSDA